VLRRLVGCCQRSGTGVRFVIHQTPVSVGFTGTERKRLLPILEIDQDGGGAIGSGCGLTAGGALAAYSEWPR
jgi:hypothetical protein